MFLRGKAANAFHVYQVGSADSVALVSASLAVMCYVVLSCEATAADIPKELVLCPQKGAKWLLTQLASQCGRGLSPQAV